MSKQSKKKRDLKKRRRARTTVASQKSQDNQWSLPSIDRNTWLWLGGGTVAVLFVGVIVWFTIGPGGSRGSSMPSNPVERNGMYSASPEMKIDPEKSYLATISTEKGDIVAELYADRAPSTVNNFVFLAREGFYDGTNFYRVLPDFMAQAGDPTGTGTGGPGYTFPDEFAPDLRHDSPGILSMANSGANTNGSQFFITYIATPWLDAFDDNGNLKDCQSPEISCHAVFGKVVQGLDVLQALTPRDPNANPDFPGDLIQTVRIDEQ
jgi:cyclophilin family peptidyl-prolyl cis-trans isomerase